MRKALQHGRNKSTPKNSNTAQQQAGAAGQMQPSFMQPPAVPMQDDPGMMLGHDQVPGAGFAPH